MWPVMQTVFARAVTLQALHGSCEEASFRARPFGIGVAIATSTLRSCCTPSGKPDPMRSAAEYDGTSTLRSYSGTAK